MANVNTIVAALDLEAGSDEVLARAIQLATAHAARLIVLHVVEAEPLSQAAAVSGRSEDELRDDLKQHALAAIEPLVIESGRTRRTGAPRCCDEAQTAGQAGGRPIAPAG